MISEFVKTYYSFVTGALVGDVYDQCESLVRQNFASVHCSPTPGSRPTHAIMVNSQTIPTRLSIEPLFKHLEQSRVFGLEVVLERARRLKGSKREPCALVLCEFQVGAGTMISSTVAFFTENKGLGTLTVV